MPKTVSLSTVSGLGGVLSGASQVYEKAGGKIIHRQGPRSTYLPVSFIQLEHHEECDVLHALTNRQASAGGPY
jgi:hypothetical protein